MTHAQLVKIAARWLRTTRRCPVVLTDAGGWHEIPDAIGFRSGGLDTLVVECKASRADFLRDQKKWHRRHGLGLGQRRVYLAPAGMVRPDEVPPGWGLAEVRPCGRVFVRVPIPKLELRDRDVTLRETRLLFSALAGAQRPRPVGGLDASPWDEDEALDEVARG